MLFSTDTDPSKSKTKCVFMCGKKKTVKPLPLYLYGRELPWVKTATHLGVELCEDGTMNSDIKHKTAAFISRSLEVREQFSFAHPMEVLSAVRVYCCDHYGSMLWDMEGDMAKQYCNSWNTCVKLAWGLSRATHTYFLEYLSGGLLSVKWDVLGRYARFAQSLISSPSREINILARVVTRDIRSTTARNLRLLEKETDGLTWLSSSLKIKEALSKKVVTVPESDA